MTGVVKPSKPTKTPEQIKEEKKIYIREYMRHRRETDKEFAEKQKEIVRLNELKKYHTNPDYKKAKNEAVKKRYATYKDAFFTLNKKQIANSE